MSRMKVAREARSAAVVINPGSRRGGSRGDRAVDRLYKAGVPISSVHHVLSGAELAATLDRAVADGHDMIVVGGGDGTVSCAAGRVAGTDVTLGILPLGTANDLARTLDIGKDLAEACAAVADGKVVDIDLGRANGEPFLNVASVGLSVGVTEALSHRLHYGGGNTVSPTAGIDDYTLDIYAIAMARVREHVRIARSLRDGSFVQHERVHHLKSRCVRLVTEPSLPVNLDGEIATATPTSFTIERNAVHVVVPQSSNSASLDGRRAPREGPSN
jgi:diacylglycerol kinase (ATP)